MKLKSLSVFFPCYNEERAIHKLITDAYHILPKVAEIFEVIIINDGSDDKTHMIASKLQKRFDNLSIVNHEENMGYGAALQSGFSRAKHEWVFFTDGDGQFNLSDILSFLPYAKTHNVIIGYRKNRADNIIRRFNAISYKLLLVLLFNLNVKDVDCAFKLINKNVINQFSLSSNGAFLSAELLIKIKNKSIVFKEIPVNHYPRNNGISTGNNPLVVLRALKDALRFFISGSN